MKQDEYEFKNQTDAVTAIQRELEQVKNIMEENIERVMERGEQLSVLLEKTQSLHESAALFQRRSRNVKRTMQWLKIKWTVTVILIILVTAHQIT